ncbi:MAG: hypothetical protein K0Q58_1423 [Microbacterium sp.]|nr:hypothetical protein [Microbacterium sp.]
MRCPTAVGSGSVTDRVTVRKSANRTLMDTVAASAPCARNRAPTRSARRRSSAPRIASSAMSSSKVSSCPMLFSTRSVSISRASSPRARCQTRAPIEGPSARSSTARGDDRTSPIVRIPRDSSASADFGPTPHSARTERGMRKSIVRSAGTMRRPSGLLAVDAIFATCFVEAAPMLQVSPVSSSTRARSIRATTPGEPQSRRAPRTSRNASSIDSGSTNGVISWKMLITAREVSA